MEDSPQPALVLDRWNSWVRVYLPESGETRWIELTPADGWEPLGAPAGAGEDGSAATLRG